jgi:hypothetical protein
MAAFTPIVPKLRDSGFIRLRSGIFQHIREGLMTGTDFIVYCTLLNYADYSTGIVETTAASLAATWAHLNDAKDKKESVQNSLQRLRKNGYIIYPKGSGIRGPYPVLIDKYEPTVGALIGWSLNLSKSNSFENPVYDYVSPTAYGEAYGGYYSRLAVEQVVDTPVMRVVGTTVQRVVSLPLQDITKMFLDVFKPLDFQESKELQVARSHAAASTRRKQRG